MKKFLVKTVLFAVIVLAIDAALGTVFRYLVPRAKGGDTGRIEYICHRTSEDLLIFGSSRAIHHYDPFLLEDSLNLSCYNCGKDGNGIILLYGWYKMIQERYAPACILYEVTPSFDLLESDNMTYLPNLRYYYGQHPTVDSIFWAVAPNERYKMPFNSYRFNSQFIQLVMDNIKPLRQDAKGYRPLQGEMQYEPIQKDKETQSYAYDSLKLYYLERLVQDCKTSGTQLIFTASPLYKSTDARVFTPIEDLCARYKIPFINHYADPVFNEEKSYFKDSGHLNQRGAEAYTKSIIQEVRPLMPTGDTCHPPML